MHGKFHAPLYVMMVFLNQWLCCSAEDQPDVSFPLSVFWPLTGLLSAFPPYCLSFQSLAATVTSPSLRITYWFPTEQEHMIW